MFSFDQYGYLTPYEVIPVEMPVFERIFVFDGHREMLYKQLINLVLDFKKLDIGSFYIWVDGSFVTTKRVPGDIDLVVFVSHLHFERAQNFHEKIRPQYEPYLDSFLAPDFPDSHRGSGETVLRKLLWKETFGFSRTGKPKGIIELNF